MILLTRAYYKARGLTPLVYGFYAPGAGKETVPDYEDGTIAHSYREHVWALGGYPAKRAKRADHSGGNLYASGRRDARSGWDEQHGRCDAGDDGFS